MLTTARNYLRLETLHAANDAITNAMAALPVFHLYDIQDTLHSSSDGQRMETQIDTINARHSPKYLGVSHLLHEALLGMRSVLFLAES